jgi:hypothetical protein
MLVRSPSPSLSLSPGLAGVPLGLGRLVHAGTGVAVAVRGALRWGAHHTGLPVVLVAALAIVLSWRLIKRGFRLALELVIAVALLVVATHLGWLSW